MKNCFVIFTILFSFCFAEEYIILQVFHDIKSHFSDEKYTFICWDSKNDNVFSLSSRVNKISFKKSYNLDILDIENIKDPNTKIIWYVR